MKHPTRLTLASLLCLVSIATAAADRPNVVLFLVDDMGWMDSGAYGSEYYQTPHIDAFARQSMRFSDAYAQPLCSPTRASILTGQHSSRHGITSAAGHTPPVKAALQEKAPPSSPWLMPQSGSYLDPAEHHTLADALRDAGYRTSHIGKWHLGLTEPHWPEHYGFEVNFHCHPDPGPPSYFSPYGVVPPGTPISRRDRQRVGNITDGPPGEHIVDRQAEEAGKFLEANRDRPFFLNLSLYGVHGPWQHKEAYTAEFAQTRDPRGEQGNPVMASMLRSVDECFGRVLAKLDELGLTENTLVIFYSDNGGNVHSWAADDRKIANIGTDHPLYETVQSYRKWAGGQPPTNNAPLRDGKGRMYEGGTRVPLMVRWPGRIEPGTTSDAVVGCIDLYPTILDLAGVPLPEKQTIDGISFAPVLRQSGKLERDAYFTWFPHLVPGVSVRQGDWKLIRRFTESPEDYEGLHELFNLREDLGETTNLASKHPEKVKELDALIDQFVKETGALYPVPNPAYNPGAAAAPSDPLDGLLPRQCDARVDAGVLKIFPASAAAFLGTAKVKHNGPMIMQLRARTTEGGAGRVEWRLEGQEAIPADSQSTSFILPSGNDWTDLALSLPVDGKTTVLRIFLPPGALEIESLRFVAADSDQVVYAWNFGSGK